jgi:hypothetical protein
MGSDELLFVTLTARLVHPTAPVLLTKNGPLGALILVFSSPKQEKTSHPFKV